jgi:hypothetical protein
MPASESGMGDVVAQVSETAGELSPVQSATDHRSEAHSDALWLLYPARSIAPVPGPVSGGFVAVDLSRWRRYNPVTRRSVIKPLS